MSLNNVTSTLPDPRWVAEVERQLAALAAQNVNQTASIRTLQGR
jgi:hypothetical protein